MSVNILISPKGFNLRFKIFYKMLISLETSDSEKIDLENHKIDIKFIFVNMNHPLIVLKNLNPNTLIM